MSHNKFTYYYISKDVCIYSEMSGYRKTAYFPLRFEYLANNKELKDLLNFVSSQIDTPNNSNWFAGYLLAFEKYDDSLTKGELRERLLNNELITIHIPDEHPIKHKFQKLYDKIPDEFKNNSIEVLCN